MKFKKEDLVKLYVNLVRTEAHDQWLIRKSMTGEMKATYHPVWGDIAPGVGGCTFLRPDDVIYAHLRGHGLPHLIGKGLPMRRFIADQMGKATGYCNGLGVMCHNNFPELGIYGESGTLGACFVLSSGWGLAAQMNGRGQVVVYFFGDGTAARGPWHEAANVSALWKLPVVWVCENNGIGQYVPTKSAYPLDDLANLASAYGMPAAVVDGQDVVAVALKVNWALNAAEKLKDRIGVEVIDPRTLEPLDLETILASLEKTGRMVIVEEGSARCGFAAELIAQVIEHGFDLLDAPIKRVCTKNYPIPAV